MTDSVTLDGVLFEADDFTADGGYGYLTDTVVNSTTYSKFIALFVAGMRDLGKALVTTWTGSIDLSTVIVGDAVSVTLAESRPWRSGAYVIIADTSAPTTKFVIIQTTTDTTATTLTGTVQYLTGAGTITAGGVQTTGKPGATGTTGAGGLTWGGRKTADFTLMPNYAYVVDCSGGAVVATPYATWAAGDHFELRKVGTGGVMTLAYSSVKINTAAASDSVAAGIVGAVRGRYDNSTNGLLTDGCGT